MCSVLVLPTANVIVVAGVVDFVSWVDVIIVFVVVLAMGLTVIDCVPMAPPMIGLAIVGVAVQFICAIAGRALAVLAVGVVADFATVVIVRVVVIFLASAAVVNDAVDVLVVVAAAGVVKGTV